MYCHTHSFIVLYMNVFMQSLPVGDFTSHLLSYLNSSDFLPENQSTYVADNSTEATTAKIVSDILLAFDHGGIATLALLNCSAAFDNVDYDILLGKLSESFRESDIALQRLTSYLEADYSASI